ncbi:response regulator [Rhodohalobacter sp.]|uniref:hybrid sensor histidine kinase/response regulator n=1 Tax=Rhodohalobacter sp. TaxID=1974210 RepID=UPI002ACDC046|nr:response regulator [Rhodohalobacter sp.]MDZ7755438.1 response regulator [Rhodohalobacter sp.]
MSTSDRSPKYSILVIEDNTGDFFLIHDYLMEQGINIKVSRAKRFSEAEQELTQDNHSYDVILLDLTLPDLSGEKLISHVTELAGDAVIIVLTGYANMEFSIRSLNLGVSDYLLKDELTPESLWKSIRYSIERKTASQNLMESEERYRILFQNNPSPMLVWDTESGVISDVNYEAEAKYGYSKEEFLDLHIDQIQFDNFEYDSEERNNGKKNYRQVWRHKKKNDEIFFAELSAQKQIEYKGKRSTLVIVNDITEKIEHQERMIEGAIRAEEEERNRISKELHDSIVQQLVACGMFAQNLQDKVGKPEEMRKEIDRLYQLLKEITHETRDISHNLKPAEFEISKLEDLVKQLVRQLTRESDISFKVNIHLENKSTFDLNLKTQLYRTLQELLANIIKHSNASEAIINLEQVGRVLYLTIQDNGSGFDVNDSDNDGIGLRNVRSRVYRLGGDVEFVNMKEKGLKINIEIPI